MKKKIKSQKFNSISKWQAYLYMCVDSSKLSNASLEVGLCILSSVLFDDTNIFIFLICLLILVYNIAQSTLDP